MPRTARKPAPAPAPAPADTLAALRAILVEAHTIVAHAAVCAARVDDTAARVDALIVKLAGVSAPSGAWNAYDETSIADDAAYSAQGAAGDVRHARRNLHELALRVRGWERDAGGPGSITLNEARDRVRGISAYLSSAEKWEERAGNAEDRLFELLAKAQEASRAGLLLAGAALREAGVAPPSRNA